MKNEKGQALPMAIMALLIGALVVVPFLTHTGTSMLDSRVYAGEIDSRSAGDAGAEHAIWDLTYGTLAAQIPNEGDSYSYQLPEKLNGVITNVTVSTTSEGSGGGTPGEIDDSVIDNYTFDAFSCNDPVIVNVSGDIYAIAYQGPGNDGFVKTLRVTPDGLITSAVIDTLEFDNEDCAEPDLVHISGNTFAISYRGPGNDGFLKTIIIDSAGNIGNGTINTLEFDTSSGYEPDVIQVSGSIYAIAYRGSSNDGFIKTVTINTAGSIGNAAIDTLEYDTSSGYEPDVIQISGSIYAIAYRGSSNDGFLKTISIAANGAIGNSVIDTLEFNTGDGYTPDIINISGSTYAVAYYSSGNDGFLTTLSVSPAGVISNSPIDTFEFDAVNGQQPKILYLAENIYAIVYNGPQNDGFFITLPIDAGATIPGTVTDTLEYDTATGFDPDLIRISENVFAVAYSLPSSKGYVVTIGISPGAAGASAYTIVSTAGDTTIRALVNIENTTAIIVSWFVE